MPVENVVENNPSIARPGKITPAAIHAPPPILKKIYTVIAVTYRQCTLLHVQHIGGNSPCLIYT
jgi:hypothetical protein